MPELADRCRRMDAENAANYAAAFSKAGDLRSGKPQALAGVAVLYALYLAGCRYPDLSLHRAIKYLLAKEQGTRGRHHRNGRLSLLDGRDVAARPTALFDGGTRADESDA